MEGLGGQKRRRGGRGGDGGGAGPTFANPFKCAHLGTIFHDMDGEVDLGEGLLLADSANGIVDLLVVVRLRATVGIHGGRRGERLEDLGGAREREGRVGESGLQRVERKVLLGINLLSRKKFVKLKLEGGAKYFECDAVAWFVGGKFCGGGGGGEGSFAK